MEQAIKIIESLMDLAFALAPDSEFYSDYEFEERIAKAQAFLNQHIGRDNHG